ncbi:MAG: hypothetical protein AAFX46_04570 [Cyanobacteria bacterium J06636_27]
MTYQDARHNKQNLDVIGCNTRCTIGLVAARVMGSRWSKWLHLTEQK